MKKLWKLEVDVRLSASDEFPIVRYQFQGVSIDDVEEKAKAHARIDPLLRDAINADGYSVDTDYSPIGRGELKLGESS